jgi:hypothetical protein
VTRLLLVLLGFSLDAAAQAPAANPAPAQTPEKPAVTQPAEPRRPLILRLDEIDGPRMSFGRSSTETEKPKDLPSLGGDARKIEPTQSSSSPYPKQYNDIPAPY